MFPRLLSYTRFVAASADALAAYLLA